MTKRVSGAALHAALATLPANERRRFLELVGEEQPAPVDATPSPDPPGSWEDLCRRRERQDHGGIRRYLERHSADLPRRAQEVAVAYFSCRRPVAAIAAELRVTPATIRWHIDHVRQWAARCGFISPGRRRIRHSPVA